MPTNQPADLLITQITPASAALLSNFTVTITVSNQGPGVATGATANDVLPAGMRLVSAFSTQGGISTNGGTLTALLGTLNVGASAQISILLRPDAIASSFNYVHVAANEPDPVMTNNSSSQPIAIATYFSQNFPLYIGDLVYDPSNGKVFATVHGAGAYSNSIIQIDPRTGDVERSLSVRFEPDKITITSDSQFLYVGTTTEGMVARVNIQAWTNDFSFGLGNDPNGIAYVVGDFAPLPAQPHSITVSMHAWYGYYNPRVAIFDDGVGRPHTLAKGGAGTHFIQASQDAARLYVVYGSTFSRNDITAAGIEPALTNITGFASDFRIEDDWLITESGQVLNLQNDTPQGTFPVTGLVSPDLKNGIVYFLVQGFGVSPIWTLVACSTNMVDIHWQIIVPGARGIAYSLTRCGPGTLAFATVPHPGGPPDPAFNQLFLVHTSVVPRAGDLVLNVATNWAFAGAYLTNAFNILNDGPYNATGVSFSNVLANGSTFVTASSTQGSCVQTNGIVTCSVGSMTAGSTVTITVVSSVTNAGSIPLQASISQKEQDLDPSNNNISSTEMIYPPPSLTVSDLSVYRQSGLTATFSVVLDSPNAHPVQLYCSTTDGSAHAPGDYQSASRILTISPGATSVSFPVTIQNNGLVKSNVVFYVNVRLTPAGAPLATASCTLINNTFYSFSVTNISLIASLGGTTNAVFIVKLSGSNYTTASVDYFTRDGNAASGKDYMAKAGTLVFPSGVTNGSISIPVYALADSAPIKSFYLILANPVNAGLAVLQAAASILNTNLIVGPSRLLGDGRFQLTVNGGVSGQSYVLLASTNLVDWTPISGFVNTNSPVTIYDSAAAQYGQRFYRIGPLSLAPAMRLTVNGGQPLSSNGFSAMLYALPGLRYEIDASLDLLSWQLVTNFVSTNSPFSFRDSNATNFSQRFYRAVRQ